MPKEKEAQPILAKSSNPPSDVKCPTSNGQRKGMKDLTNASFASVSRMQGRLTNYRKIAPKILSPLLTTSAAFTRPTLAALKNSSQPLRSVSEPNLTLTHSKQLPRNTSVFTCSSSGPNGLNALPYSLFYYFCCLDLHSDFYFCLQYSSLVDAKPEIKPRSNVVYLKGVCRSLRLEVCREISLLNVSKTIYCFPTF